MKDHIQHILQEISEVLEHINEDEVRILLDHIIKAHRIVTAGAGRMGLAMQGFSMRLAQLELKSYYYRDTTLPHVGKRDLIIVASGSGETKSILELVRLANATSAPVALITAHTTSSMSRRASVRVILPAPYKTMQTKRVLSIQPMTTLTEQCLMVFLDALVLSLMKSLNKTSKDMWSQHSNLE